MSDERDEIRNRIDLVDLVGQRVLLKKTGKHWKGLCPFHEDRNPSFYVNRELGHYRCWSCGESGDCFTWVMKTQNLEFVDALKMLANLAGVELKGKPGKNESQKKVQLEIMNFALRFFQEQLSQADESKSYCAKRRLTPEIIEKWKIGFSPSSDHSLAFALRKAGYSLSIAQELFLVEDDGSGGFYDKFRGRLMFPIWDERGDLVAFGGRALGDQQPKYINSGDTPLFRKSRVLYGLFQSKDALKKNHQAVLVEGYLDVIACHEAGVDTAIASLGTAFTSDHANLLKRWCESITILYDRDPAGEKAAGKACEMLEQAQIPVRIALMPAGEDPDTLLREAGPVAVMQAVEKDISPLQFKLYQVERTLDPKSPEFWNAAVSLLANSSSMIEIEQEVARLAGTYLAGSGSGSSLSLHQRIRELRQSQRKGSKARPGFAAAHLPAADDLLASERVILKALLGESLRQPAFEALDQLSSPFGKLIAAELQSIYSIPPAGAAQEWTSRLENESVRAALIGLLMNPDGLNTLVIEREMKPVSETELRHALIQLRNDEDRKAVATLRTNSPNADALSEAFAKVKDRWDRSQELDTP